MLQDLCDNDPRVVVLLAGDGMGDEDDVGFHSNIERMHKTGWEVELISWIDSCSSRMRNWTNKNGQFIALDTHYYGITFLEPSKPGWMPCPPRCVTNLQMHLRGKVVAPTVKKEEEECWKY